MLKRIREKDGYMTIETILVFSVSFLAILLFIFMGMVLFQQVNYSSLAAKAASRGSIIYVTRTSDMGTGKRTLADFKDRDPYRYIFDSKIGETSDIVNAFVAHNVGTNNIIAGEDKSGSRYAEINNYFITKKTVVSIRADYEMPIDAVTGMFGIDPIFKVDVKAVAPVTDPVEFIRNTDLCVDLIRNTEAGGNAIQKLGEIKSKVIDMQNILKTGE